MNSLNIDLKNKKVILDPKYYRGTEKERTFLCEGGLGCFAETKGQSIYGYWTLDKEKGRIRGGEILKLAK